MIVKIIAKTKKKMQTAKTTQSNKSKSKNMNIMVKPKMKKNYGILIPSYIPPKRRIKMIEPHITRHAKDDQKPYATANAAPKIYNSHSAILILANL